MEAILTVACAFLLAAALPAASARQTPRRIYCARDALAPTVATCERTFSLGDRRTFAVGVAFWARPRPGEAVDSGYLGFRGTLTAEWRSSTGFALMRCISLQVAHFCTIEGEPGAFRRGQEVAMSATAAGVGYWSVWARLLARKS